jgi:hypothetical protein
MKISLILPAFIMASKASEAISEPSTFLRGQTKELKLKEDKQNSSWFDISESRHLGDENKEGEGVESSFRFEQEPVIKSYTETMNCPHALFDKHDEEVATGIRNNSFYYTCYSVTNNGTKTGIYGLSPLSADKLFENTKPYTILDEILESDMVKNEFTLECLHTNDNHFSVSYLGDDSDSFFNFSDLSRKFAYAHNCVEDTPKTQKMINTKLVEIFPSKNVDNSMKVGKVLVIVMGSSITMAGLYFIGFITYAGASYYISKARKSAENTLKTPLLSGNETNSKSEFFNVPPGLSGWATVVDAETLSPPPYNPGMV